MPKSKSVLPNGVIPSTSEASSMDASLRLRCVQHDRRLCFEQILRKSLLQKIQASVVLA
jgi:hypothetical protein